MTGRATRSQGNQRVRLGRSSAARVREHESSVVVRVEPEPPTLDLRDLEQLVEEVHVTGNGGVFNDHGARFEDVVRARRQPSLSQQCLRGHG